MLKTHQGRDTISSTSYDFLIPWGFNDKRRVGRSGDGGYFIRQSDILNCDAIYSFGVCDDWSFEEDLLALNKVPLRCFDYSVSLKVFFTNALVQTYRFLRGKIPAWYFRRVLHTPFSYYNFFIASRGQRIHYQKRLHQYRDLPFDITADEVFQNAGFTNIFLKIDIEGSEYHILSQVLSHANKIRSIVIEFHDIHTFEDVFIKHIHALNNYYKIVHIHANNNRPVMKNGLPDGLEITFTRRQVSDDGSEFLKNWKSPNDEPPNTIDKPGITLEFTDVKDS